MTYHVLPIGVTVLVIYLFSLYLSFAGFTGRQSHRRFWNWILLGSFFFTALFGLLMALKVTYKWNIPFSDPLLHWHVETGIAMAFSAIIHLTWHLGYYFGKARHRIIGARAEQGEPPPAAKINHVVPLLILTGFVSSSAQFILMREAVILGGGTEASAGLFLWIWLISAAAGAVTGSSSTLADVRKMVWTLLAGTALAPLLFVLMNTVLLVPGSTPSFFQIMVIVSVSTAPVTFISALVFVRISALRQATGLSSPGNSFGAETAGSVLAGVITAATVMICIPNYRLYMLVLVLSTAIAVILSGYRPWIRIAAVALLLPLAPLAFILRPDLPVRSLLLHGVKVEESIDTQYGNITTGTYGGANTVFYDHRPLFFEGDIITAEENIHYALLQRENYNRVLLISGGLSRHLGELEKHWIKELVYLEPDPGIVAATGARDTVCGTMKVTVASRDPVSYMRNDGEIYDAVLQLIPPPSTISVSRFYTAEYFRLVKEHLSPDGIFMCIPMPYYNYSPESYRKGFSPLYNALASVFSHIAIIPGSSLYAVASSLPVDPSVASLADSRGILTSYVNSDYISDSELRTRREQVLSQVDRKAGKNTALKPVSTVFANILSLERMGMKGGIIALLIMLAAIPFIFSFRGGMMMFASSAGLAGFGMIMIFILQMAVGNIYVLSAVILTMLMSGLAAGAAWGETLNLKSLALCILLLTFIYAATGFMAPTLVSSAAGLVLSVMFLSLPAAGLFFWFV
ncbi:hypothetical protein EG827_09995, partial [bacterium]|nr:hypothetical protein [bacterium]